MRDPERMITVHDLLTHQSGLSYDFLFTHPADAIYRNMINGARSEGFDLAGLTDKLAELPRSFHPAQHEYWSPQMCWVELLKYFARH